ncbi:DUF4064 domain-containing protein [Staphylococcus haemolyticus]|uniref:DUF4064 domain-containing protein n=1 Tax=Staphylococcus haemolyticus TaxID=1283 RepID=UPI001A94764B|nr:DUF4064 domain-containing protein [Staphylococcus haemolyticus]MCH4388466.1 DUF4064 domain-containing protein [Staphylococcus haemolyticus]QTK08331.1 DUF4064 domain-containing protein [Staphylococcus haemolyticus]QTK10498.1 DUF4064 domain-containing protein [Staphylococcus haemolyticus]QTK12682.1 DUF4064 domain-containing protein [Staphylococcus haemolyticus]
MANQTNDYTSHHTQNNKIKRTVEHILTWLGVVLQAIVAIMFLVLKPLMGNNNFRDQMISEAQKQGNSVSTSELNQGIDALGSFLSFLTWGAVIALILAIIGGILISKKPKIAGVLLIIAGLIALLSNWISVILWIVAGIMLLVRKGKKKDNYANGYYDNNNRRENHHDDKDVNAKNNAFILDEEDKAKEQRDIKEHYSNDDVHNGSHNHSNHNEERSQFGSRSDRYQDEAHKDLNDFDKDRNEHKDNDFVRDEADKLKDKKDNDPYKY